MLEMIRNRQTGERKGERYDLFSSLLDANDEEDGGGGIKLTDQELLGKFYISSRLHATQLKPFFQGNVFIFLVAGHEVSRNL